MNFKILKNIVLVNLKKNWVMILSFFVFLIVSCSMLFGMTSFIIGMRSQIPEESFNQNKDFINVGTSQICFSKGQGYQKYQLTDEMKKISNDTYSDLVKGIVEPGNDDAEKIINNRGILNSKLGIYNDEQIINKINKKMYDEIGLSNFTAYVLETKVFNKQNSLISFNKSNKTIVPKVWASVSANPIKDGVGYDNASIQILDQGDKELIDRLSDNGFYEHPEYKNSANVFFTNFKTYKSKKFKLGQSYLIDNGTEKDNFRYGGIFAPDVKKIYADANYSDAYYLKNIKSDSEFACKQSPDIYSSTYFLIYYPAIYKSGTFLDFINTEGENVHKIFTGIIDKSDITIRFKTYWQLYAALFALNICFIAILVTLDIVLSWFLIKEIINSLSSQLLFLKAMGLKDSEASLINAISILLLLLSGCAISLVGMLGIQAAFTNMITNFMDIILKWNYIQPMTWILIIGLLVFMFGVYFASNYLMVSKLNLASNAVVKKSDFWFSKFRKSSFKVSTNYGLTVSFNIKNLAKMFVAFLITLLMTTISFVSVEFDQSMGQNVKGIRILNNYKKTYSYEKLKTRDFNDDGSPVIEYKNSLQSEDAENQISKVSDITPNLSGKWIKSSDMLNFYNTDGFEKTAMLLGLPNKNDFLGMIKKYKESIASEWPNASSDFNINFNVMYKNNADADATVSLAPEEKLIYDRMIVLDDKDPRTKRLFKKNKNEFIKTKKLAIACAYGTAVNSDWKVGDTLEMAIDLTNGHTQEMANEQNSKKVSVELANMTTEIVPWEMFYVRKTDFIEYLKTLGDNPLAKAWIKQIPLNAYYTNDVPNVVQQQLFLMNKNTHKFQAAVNNIIPLEQAATSKYDLVHPLVQTLIIILLLGIVLMITFIIFMDMTIMTENDNIIFIMKALGYGSPYILKRIISGYFIVIALGFIGGLLISWGILKVLNNLFLPVLFAKISFLWTWPVITLIIAMVIILTGITIAISANKVYSRSLTVREE